MCPPSGLRTRSSSSSGPKYLAKKMSFPRAASSGVTILLCQDVSSSTFSLLKAHCLEGALPYSVVEEEANLHTKDHLVGQSDAGVHFVIHRKAQRLEPLSTVASLESIPGQCLPTTPDSWTSLRANLLLTACRAVSLFCRSCCKECRRSEDKSVRFPSCKCNTSFHTHTDQESNRSTSLESEGTLRNSKRILFFSQ